MFPAWPGMKILVFRSIETVQPFIDILHRVAVDGVHDDDQPHAVRRVYQRFKLLRCSESTRNRKEITHMIAEAPIERVLHYRHQLHRIVAEIGDPWQDIPCELRKCADPSLLLRHPHMRLVNSQPAFPLRRPVFPGVGRGRLPVLPAEAPVRLVLHNTPNVSRNPIHAADGRTHVHFNSAPVSQAVFIL